MLNAIFPGHNKDKDVYYQGSRQMTSTSRRYFEKELGAGLGPSPGFGEHFGYTEPLRRFIQREGFVPRPTRSPTPCRPGCPARITTPTSTRAIRL
jgi:hypothetical protein